MAAGGPLFQDDPDENLAGPSTRHPTPFARPNCDYGYLISDALYAPPLDWAQNGYNRNALSRDYGMGARSIEMADGRPRFLEGP